MQAFIISDKEYQTPAYMKLHQLVISFLQARAFFIEQVQLGRDDLAFCMGCFGCWVKKPGECVIDDAMSAINRTYVNSDVAIYLCPVVFGQFSANIKNAIDRWLPNMLPFFETRPDGSSIHPSRYHDYPKQIFIGYGDALSQSDAQLFVDIIQKHRTNVEAFVFEQPDVDGIQRLSAIQLCRGGGQL